MAKTTGKISGNIKFLYMDDVLVGCATANGLTLTNETVEDTCKDGNNPPTQTFQAGIQSWSMTGTFTVRFDDPNQYSAVTEAAVGATIHTWKFATANADDPYWQGDGFISSFSEAANINSPHTFDITISSTSAIYLFNT